MTEEEKRSERELKAETAKWLQEHISILIDSHKETVAADVRIEEYICNIVNNPDKHNLYELLKIKRFFHLLDKWQWRAQYVKRKIKLYESLKFSGTSGRRSYKLTPVQVFQIASLFGFFRPDGRRLTRIAYIFVPRKFSKTTFAAFLAVDDLLFGDDNAEAYIGANSYDQALKCFNEVRAIMFTLDPRQKHFRINRESIKFKNLTRDSLVQCLTANVKTKDGLFASLAVLDEYAQARNTATTSGADLKNVLTTSMGPRKNPLTIIITTASDVLDGPCYNEIEGAKRVLRGEIENDSLFADLFLPDVDDEENDPNTWAKVQPHLGVTVQPDFYELEYQNALLSADAMLAFRTKLLNIFAENEQRSWISSTLARSVSKPIKIEEIKERPDAMVAVDLSESDDFSAVTVGFYTAGERRYDFHTAYFFPDGALEGHPNERLYRVWAEKGYLILTHGDVIDYRVIVEYILKLNEYVRILGIGYDSWKSQEMINMLGAAGAESVLTPVKQTYGNFTAPVESFEHGVKTGHIFINDNPINYYCFGNAVLDVDKLDNCKPIKRKQTQKIDGVITKLMCMRLFIDYVR